MKFYIFQVGDLSMWIRDSESGLFPLLLLTFHHLELVNLLQLGDFEGSVGLTGLHLQVVDLHVPLLHLVLHVELLSEDGAALLVELLAQAERSSLLMAAISGRDPTFSSTA